SFPVGLGEHTLMVATAGEQQTVHLTIGAVFDIIPTQPGSIRGIEDLSDRFTRHRLRRGIGSSREFPGPKLEDQLRSDLAYYEYSSSVACPIHAAEGAYTSVAPCTPWPVPNHTIILSGAWPPNPRLTAPNKGDIQAQSARPQPVKGIDQSSAARSGFASSVSRRRRHSFGSDGIAEHRLRTWRIIDFRHSEI